MTGTELKKSHNTLTATETAEHLSKVLGGKASHWAIWLANDRRPTRVNKLLPQEPGPGRPRYDATLIDNFALEYKRTHQLPDSRLAIKKSSNGDNSRLAASITALTAENGAVVPAVLLVISKPLVTFQLTPDEARAMAARLVNAANQIEEAQQ